MLYVQTNQLHQLWRQRSDAGVMSLSCNLIEQLKRTTAASGKVVPTPAAVHTTQTSAAVSPTHICPRLACANVPATCQLRFGEDRPCSACAAACRTLIHPSPTVSWLSIEAGALPATRFCYHMQAQSRESQVRQGDTHAHNLIVSHLSCAVLINSLSSLVVSTGKYA